MPQEGSEFRALPEDQEVRVALEFKPIWRAMTKMCVWCCGCDIGGAQDLEGVWRLDRAEFGRIFQVGVGKCP